MVMELSRPSDFRAFTLQNPPRLVIDLPALSWQAGQPAPPPGSLVRAIHAGVLQPGISRVVVDLTNNAAIQSAFSLPSSGTNPDRLVIDFAKADTSYNPTTQKTFGSLNTVAPDFHGTAVDTGDHVLKLPPQAATVAPKTNSDAASAPPAAAFKGKKPIIVIDAGHGGQDPGALGDGGHREKDVTLAAALELRKELEATGRYTVYMTRSKDVFIILQDRVKIARRYGADLFISLHADSIDKPGVHGASIYTLSNKASDAQTAKLAARENRADLIAGIDLNTQDKEVADILIDLAMRDTMNQSKFFANTVVKQANARDIDMLEGPHRFAGFAVLKAPDVPSVLIEMGFMSNRREVNQLSSDEGRQRIAGTIVAGVNAYFAKVQKNSQN